MTTNEKLNELRKLMIKNKIDGYLVDDSDNHSSEYVNDYYKDRSFLSNFLGSNGRMLVTLDKSYLFTDGRYFIQAELDLKNTEIILMKMGEPGVPKYSELINQELKDKTLGFNGDRFSYEFIDSLDKSITLKSNLDLIKELYTPTLEFKDIVYSNESVMGESVSSKLLRIRKELDGNSLFLSRLDDIAWIYNLRGSDVLMSMLFFSFTYIDSDNAYLFIKEDKLHKNFAQELKKFGVVIKDYDLVKDFLSSLNNKTIVLPFGSTNYSYIKVLEKNNKLINKESPTLLFKAIKNEIEIKNDKEIHIDDGLAIFRFQKYIKENYLKEDFDEWGLALKSLDFRKRSKRYISLSFDTISAFKENGAIIHYEPNENKSRKVDKDSFLLLDSGAQYIGGTTDITRTYSLGNVTEEEKLVYTLVLKGHIGILLSKMENGSNGYPIDQIARKPLKEHNLDYKHGTGHGIGYMLNVHEGPNAFRNEENGYHPIYPNMITSNEPGCYFEGKFGVRIESEVLSYLGSDNMIHFESITYAPIDLDPIKKELLTVEELKCLNDYHKMVYEKLSPLVSGDELEYLKKVTREL